MTTTDTEGVTVFAPQPVTAGAEVPEAPAYKPNVPKDADDASATGYALWDMKLERFVSGVTKDKPKAKTGQRIVRV